VIRDIRRKIEGDTRLEERFGPLFLLAHQVRTQDQRQQGWKLYSLHALEVEFGNTLRPVLAELEALTGAPVERVHVDEGYRGHNHPSRLTVWISGWVRGVTRTIRREMRRGAAVESLIGHLEAEHRMDGNLLKGRDGDRANAVLGAAGYNYRLLQRWLERLLRAFIRVLLARLRTLNMTKTNRRRRRGGWKAMSPLHPLDRPASLFEAFRPAPRDRQAGPAACLATLPVATSPRSPPRMIVAWQPSSERIHV